MKKSILLTAALSLSIAGFTSVPVLAELRSSQPVTKSTVMIPQAAAIVIVFPSDVIIEDVGKMQEHPITLLLAQPLLDSQGNVVAPANSPVSSYLKPSNGGVQIVVESIVVGGRVIAVQTNSLTIPVKEVTIKQGIDRAQQHGVVASSLAGGVGEAFSNNPEVADKIEAAAGVVGALIGLTSPKKMQAAVVPQGSSYVLKLQAPVIVPVE